MNILTTLIATSSPASRRQQMEAFLDGLFRGEIDPGELFTRDYQQVSDGHSLDYPGFLRHLSHVRQQVSRIAFRVEQVCCDDTLLADRHIVSLVHQDGKQTRIEVCMFAQLRAGKICQIDEVTRVLCGDPADRALAHATEA